MCSSLFSERMLYDFNCEFTKASHCFASFSGVLPSNILFMPFLATPCSLTNSITPTVSTYSSVKSESFISNGRQNSPFSVTRSMNVYIAGEGISTFP